MRSSLSCDCVRGQSLVGCTIELSINSKKLKAECVEFDSIAQTYTILDDTGKRHERQRFHGKGAVKMTVVTEPASFVTAAAECGLCDDSAAHVTQCCRHLLCEGCVQRSNEQLRAYRWSVSVVPEYNPRLCPFCKQTA